MQISKQRLIQIIKEELNEGGAMGHYMPNLNTPAGDTPEDIAKEMLESGQEITEETVTQAALDAGVLDDDLPDFVDAIINTLQDEGWERQVWKDASAQRGTQRPSHRPRMMNVGTPNKGQGGLEVSEEKKGMSRHAYELYKNMKKGYSPQAAVTAVPDHDEGEKRLHKMGVGPYNEKPRRGKKGLDESELASRESLEEMIKKQLMEMIKNENY